MSPRLKSCASLIAAVACLAGVAAGCGGSSGGSDGDGIEPASLDGRTFTSTGVTGHELVAGTDLSISFEGDILSASAGCNSVFGEYRLEGDRLTVPKPGSTMRGCEPDLLKQDQWLSDFLVAGADVESEEGTLTLTGEDATIALDEAVQGDRTITGVTWKLESMGSGGAVTNVWGGPRTATLRIDGHFAEYQSGCNGGSGQVEVREASIEFRTASWTEMACKGQVMKVERAMQQVFDGEASVAFDGPNLVLSRNGTTLEFRPE